jgi:hypothetical protein
MSILKKAVLPVGLIAILGASAMAQYPDSVSIFTDAKDLVRSKSFSGNGVFGKDTVTGDAFEGKKCIKYSYDLAGGYWDGFGLNLGSVSAVGTTAIRLAYKGPSGGASLGMTIIDRVGGTSSFTGLMEAPDWLLSDYPLTDFSSGTDSVTGNPKPADFNQISSIRFDIGSGAATGTGVLYLDDIWFMGGTFAGIRNPSHAPMASGKQLVTKSSGTMVTTISNLNGQVLRQNEQTVSANQQISLHTAFENQIPAGMYVLTIKGAGINVSRQIVR